MTPRQVFDVDRHVIEPFSMWQEYLPRKYHSYIPYFETEKAQRVNNAETSHVEPQPRLMIDGQPLQPNLGIRARQVLAKQNQERTEDWGAASHPHGQLQHMDATGVDVALLLPTLGNYVTALDQLEPAVSVAFAEAYNRWIFDYAAVCPERLFPAAILARQEPESLVGQLQAALQGGARAILLRPNPVTGRTLGSPEYARFWSAVERAQVAVVLHEGTHSGLVTAGAERFTSRFALHACSHPMEHMMALVALLEGGVLEAHPELRFAFLEAGASWLPYWLWRLDELEYRYLREEVMPHVRHRPSEYFRRQCWVTIEPEEPGLSMVANSVGADRLLFGSDFPHPDHEAAGVLGQLESVEDLTHAERARLLWDNAWEFLGGSRAPSDSQSRKGNA